MHSDRLLPSHVPRSEASDLSHSQDLEASGEPCPPPDCITGAFADRALEASFSARCFQTAQPLHLGLMTLALVADVSWVLRHERSNDTIMAVAGDVAMLLGRVGLHRMSNGAAAQRVGGIAWTCYVLSTCFYFLALSTSVEQSCNVLLANPVYLLVTAFVLAYMNSSLGLGFWHKTALCAICLLPALQPEVLTVGCMAVYVFELVMIHGLCHLLELRARRAFHVGEQLREAKERLVIWRDQLMSAPSSSTVHAPCALAEQTVSSPPHRFTGVFADPARGESFSANCFRVGYSIHMSLFTMALVADMLTALAAPSFAENIKSGEVSVAQDVVLLVGRVGLHRMSNRAAAQRIGGITWTCIVLAMSAYFHLVFGVKLFECDAISFTMYILGSASIISYLNTSLGLGFWHKNALWAAWLLPALRPEVLTGSCTALFLCELVLSHGLCHVLELHARHAFHCAEELRKLRERLSAFQKQTISNVANASALSSSFESRCWSETDGPAPDAVDARTDATSSGPFSIRAHSLWSGWSAVWSDPDITYKEKLSREIGRHVQHGADFNSFREAAQRARAFLAESEARKATRRAAQYGDAHGRLVWKLLRRSQSDPSSPFSDIPKDALRIIVDEYTRGEIARLESVFSQRLAAGATSYRG